MIQISGNLKGLSFILQELLSLCKHFFHPEFALYIYILMNNLSLYLSEIQTQTKAWGNINKKN